MRSTLRLDMSSFCAFTKKRRWISTFSVLATLALAFLSTIGTVAAQVVASSDAGTILCHGGTTTVTVTATGGEEPYTGTGDFVVSAGSYSFTVTDGNGFDSVTTGF